MSEPLIWHPISTPPEKTHGWFCGAMLPVNSKELTLEAINGWRRKFGFTRVWYNADSVGKWYEPDPVRDASTPIAHRLTHWAELPFVPDLTTHPSKE